jgi:hypothetical protein
VLASWIWWSLCSLRFCNSHRHRLESIDDQEERDDKETSEKRDGPSKLTENLGRLSGTGSARDPRAVYADPPTVGGAALEVCGTIAAATVTAARSAGKRLGRDCRSRERVRERQGVVGWRRRGKSEIALIIFTKEAPVTAATPSETHAFLPLFLIFERFRFTAVEALLRVLIR